MHITTQLPSKETPPGQLPRPADHFCMPHQGRTPTSPQLPLRLQEPQVWEISRLLALAACPGPSSGRGNQNGASLSFPQNAIFQEWEML